MGAAGGGASASADTARPRGTARMYTGHSCVSAGEPHTHGHRRRHGHMHRHGHRKQRDTARHRATQRDTERHSETQSDTARHRATQRDTERHSETRQRHADTQTHAQGDSHNDSEGWLVSVHGGGDRAAPSIPKFGVRTATSITPAASTAVRGQATTCTTAVIPCNHTHEPSRGGGKGASRSTNSVGANVRAPGVEPCT